MKLNYIPIGSTDAGFLKEEYINKLDIYPYSESQFTINNTIEKYYPQITTTLLVDNYSDLYIKFFMPHMITSDDERNFYQMLGYIPLTKKYFYSFNASSNYTENGDYITIDVTLNVYDYIYNKKLARNYLSNIHIYDSIWIASLPLRSTLQFKLHFKNVTDVIINSTTIDDVISDLVIKMNCILFDDIIIYEKFKTEQTLEMFISNKLYGPITFRYNNLLFSENDKIAKPYTTLVTKNDSTVINVFDTVITNWILYKDFVYYLDFKSGDTNSFNFLSYSNILPAHITPTNLDDVVHNNYSNKNYIFANFFYNSYNIMNSFKFRNLLTDTDDINYSKITNYLVHLLNLNYSTRTENDNIILTLKHYDEDQPIKEFKFYDKDSKYKKTMTNWYENDENLFKKTSLNVSIIKIDPPNESVSEIDTLSSINVCLKSYITFSPYQHRGQSLSINGDNQTKHQSCINNIQISNDSYINDYYMSFFGNSGPNNSHVYANVNFDDVVIPTMSEYYTNHWLDYIRSCERSTMLLGGLMRACTACNQDNINNYDVDGGHIDVRLSESTIIPTQLANDCDEFTFSFIFCAKKQNSDFIFKMGDFLEVNNNELFIFKNKIQDFTNMFDYHKNYNIYNNNGSFKHSAGYIPQTILVTIRYYYGAVTVDFINISLSDNMKYEYDTKREEFSIDFINRQDIKLSHFTIVTNIASYDEFKIGDIDIKDRYVEDFLLYDFKNGLRKNGNGMVIGLY